MKFYDCVHRWKFASINYIHLIMHCWCNRDLINLKYCRYSALTCMHRFLNRGSLCNWNKCSVCSGYILLRNISNIWWNYGGAEEQSKYIQSILYNQVKNELSASTKCPKYQDKANKRQFFTTFRMKSAIEAWCCHVVSSASRNSACTIVCKRPSGFPDSSVLR